jgi:hypothetical protein
VHALMSYVLRTLFVLSTTQAVTRSRAWRMPRVLRVVAKLQRGVLRARAERARRSGRGTRKRRTSSDNSVSNPTKCDPKTESMRSFVGASFARSGAASI